MAGTRINLSLQAPMSPEEAKITNSKLIEPKFKESKSLVTLDFVASGDRYLAIYFLALIVELFWFVQSS